MATADEYAAWIVKNADKRGTPEFEIVAAAYKDARSGGGAAAPAQAAQSADEPFPVKLGRQVLNAGAGALRGAGSIGATILTPYDLLAGNTKSIGNPERRKLMDEGFASMGADTDSLAYGAGKLGAEVAGTLGVGGAAANVLGRAPGVAAAAPNLLNAIRTGGMATGAPAATNAIRAAAQLGTRAVGGATTGGAAAALIDPDSAGTGAIIGGALPVVTKTLGAAGSWLASTQAGQAVASAFKSGGEKGAQAAIRAMGMQGREAELLALLRGGSAELVPGSRPTVAQALVGTPAQDRAGIYERVVAKSPGGERLLDAYTGQGAARKNALEAVAPTNALGLAQAREDFGTTIANIYRPEEARVGAAARGMYEANKIDPGGMAAIELPLAEFRKSLDMYLGPGVTGQGKDAFAHMQTADKIGTYELPAVQSVKGGKPQSLLDAVKAAGGINESSLSSQMLRGELAGLRQEGLGRVIYKNKGLSAARMAEKMREAGFIAEDDSALLLDMLRSNPRDTYAASADLDAMFQRAADHAAGGVPGAETVPRAVPWRELQNFRSSLGDAWDRVASKDGMKREAAALASMRHQLDNAIEHAASGGGAGGDVMPQSVVDAWREANKSFQAYQQRFHEGPQAALFKMRDGQPLRQGGEIPGLFWGSRPGLADDVRAFRKLTEDSPAMLGQFKSMITTEGLSTQTKTGQELSAKFPQWVDQHITGLREALTPAELESVQRIALDIQRALKAGVAGKGPGATSDTYQLGANALNVGLLDSTAAKLIAARLPYAQAARSWGAEKVGMSRARNAAGFLADAGEAQNQIAALVGVRQPNALQRLLSNSDLAQLGYRAAPALVTGR